MARQNVSVTDDAAKIGLDVETASRAMSSRTPRMRMPLGRWLTRARKLRPADVAAYGLIVLVGTLFAVACFSIWSWVGALLALALIVTLALAAPFMPAEATMRLYRAEPMDLRHGLPFYRMADVISHRAGLPVVPKLYVIPSLTVNAFAAGRPGHAAIALSEGLLRRLSLAEAGAVIAHEISHIRNDDLATLSRADLTARLMQAMWLAGLVLLALSLPDYLAGQSRMPWLAIMVLFATPALANLLQLALSRQREFDADLDAVRLTGSPGDRWLLCERSLANDERKYYLLHLDESATLRELVTLARSRWPIEQQYRELKDDLGFDHFEGRTYRGWTHHVVLTAVAFTFLQLERRRDAPGPRPTLPTVRLWVREIMGLLYILNTERILNMIESFRRNPPLRR